MKVLANDLVLGPPPGSLGDDDTSSPRVEITAWPLCPRPTPVAHGRELVRQTLTTLGLSDEAVDDGVIMVSELATNAVRYARGPYELRIYRTDRIVVCEVVDGLGVLPQRREDKASQLVLRDVDSIDEHGRGLEVVFQLSGGHCGARLTTTCATTPMVDGKAVWFAMHLHEKG